MTLPRGTSSSKFPVLPYVPWIRQGEPVTPETRSPPTSSSNGPFHVADDMSYQYVTRKSGTSSCIGVTRATTSRLPPPNVLWIILTPVIDADFPPGVKAVDPGCFRPAVDSPNLPEG